MDVTKNFQHRLSNHRYRSSTLVILLYIWFIILYFIVDSKDREFGRFVGWMAYSLWTMVFLLGAREPLLTRFLGLDRQWQVHKWIAIAAVFFSALHAATVIRGEVDDDEEFAVSMGAVSNLLAYIGTITAVLRRIPKSALRPIDQLTQTSFVQRLRSLGPRIVFLSKTNLSIPWVVWYTIHRFMWLIGLTAFIHVSVLSPSSKIIVYVHLGLTVYALAWRLYRALRSVFRARLQIDDVDDIGNGLCRVRCSIEGSPSRLSYRLAARRLLKAKPGSFIFLFKGSFRPLHPFSLIISEGEKSLPPADIHEEEVSVTESEDTEKEEGKEEEADELPLEIESVEHSLGSTAITLLIRNTGGTFTKALSEHQYKALRFSGPFGGVSLEDKKGSMIIMGAGSGLSQSISIWDEVEQEQKEKSVFLGVTRSPTLAQEMAEKGTHSLVFYTGSQDWLSEEALSVVIERENLKSSLFSGNYAGILLGRPTDDDLRIIFSSTLEKAQEKNGNCDPKVFLCGPRILAQKAIYQLRNLGIPLCHIYIERFLM